MDATLIRIGPRLKKWSSQTSASTPEPSASTSDPRTFEFFCVWAGEAKVLQELIFALVDWGPFEIRCESQEEAHPEHCRCEVRYNGTTREQTHLMASFWGIMESFPPFDGPSCSDRNQKEPAFTGLR